jgi:hypothetical protein
LDYKNYIAVNKNYLYRLVVQESLEF